VGLGLRSIVVFLFSFIQPLQFFRPPLEEGLSYIFEANARKGKEGRALREAAAEEGEEQQRCEEGMQETIIQSQMVEGKGGHAYGKQQQKRVRTGSGSLLSSSRRGRRSCSGKKKGIQEAFFNVRMKCNTKNGRMAVRHVSRYENCELEEEGVGATASWSLLHRHSRTSPLSSSACCARRRHLGAGAASTE